MALPPEYVPEVQELLARARSIVRIAEGLLKEIGTPADEVCRSCEGTGVVVWTSPLDGRVENNPCGCPKGAPFRAAAAMQRAKSVGRERAAGERE